ncbi:hypothetical protein [Burkholderia diffusa]|uniref:hypothetical protein n=1 Tax=Burkholderia diffusa TaxID=488732 RepID=UPI0012D8966B|nr:hypothetical protein [Burkholderia diffusa]
MSRTGTKTFGFRHSWDGKCGLIPVVTHSMSGYEDIVPITTKVVSRGGRMKANRVLSLLKMVFRWAKERCYIEESPVLPAGGVKVDCPKGARTLSTALLEMFAADESGMMRKLTARDLRCTAAFRMGTRTSMLISSRGS